MEATGCAVTVCLLPRRHIDTVEDTHAFFVFFFPAWIQCKYVTFNVIIKGQFLIMITQERIIRETRRKKSKFCE